VVDYINAHCRLNLPGEVVENQHAKASYDVNTGKLQACCNECVVYMV